MEEKYIKDGEWAVKDAVCIKCGRPAKFISKKYPSPLCQECATEEAIKIGLEHGVPEEFVEVDDYFTQPCEEMLNVVKELAIEPAQEG